MKPILISTLILFLVSCSKKRQYKCEGKDPGSCVCTQEYAPVCGCDDKTYGNKCMAECSGITSYTEGECR